MCGGADVAGAGNRLAAELLWPVCPAKALLVGANGGIVISICFIKSFENLKLGNYHVQFPGIPCLGDRQIVAWHLE